MKIRIYIERSRKNLNFGYFMRSDDRLEELCILVIECTEENWNGNLLGRTY